MAGSSSPRRLRIPSVLAVAVIGASASAAVAFGACKEATPAPVDGRLEAPRPDGRRAADALEARPDAGLADADLADAQPVDARPVDASPPPLDAPPDTPVV